MQTTKHRDTSHGHYRADVHVGTIRAVEQVHFWDDAGENYLVHSAGFPTRFLGQGAISDMTLDDYASAMLGTIIREHKRTRKALEPIVEQTAPN